MLSKLCEDTTGVLNKCSRGSSSGANSSVSSNTQSGQFPNSNSTRTSKRKVSEPNSEAVPSPAIQKCPKKRSPHKPKMYKGRLISEWLPIYESTSSDQQKLYESLNLPDNDVLLAMLKSKRSHQVKISASIFGQVYTKAMSEGAACVVRALNHRNPSSVQAIPDVEAKRYVMGYLDARGGLGGDRSSL